MGLTSWASVAGVTLGAFVAAGCSDGGPMPPTGIDAGDVTTYIALQRDFAGFRSWERIPIDAGALPTGTNGGAAYVYINRRPPPGTTRVPIGTILLKTIEHDDPTRWIVHGMVKRGVPFNARGAVGWEFFELRLTETGEPVIVWRGVDPLAGHGYGRPAPDGGTLELRCNDCHAPHWQTDAVLTRELDPR